MSVVDERQRFDDNLKVLYEQLFCNNWLHALSKIKIDYSHQSI